MGYLAPEVSPEHLDGIEPGTVGRQVKQHQPTRRSTQNRFDLIVFVGIGVVPGHVDDARRMLLQQRFEQLGDLGATLTPADQDDRLASMVVHRPDAVALFGLGGRRDYHLLALRTPHGLEGGHPAQVELVGVVEVISRFEYAVAGLFDHLFLRAYSESGLLMVCWGRLSTIPAAFRCIRTVSYSTRMPVCSAM